MSILHGLAWILVGMGVVPLVYLLFLSVVALPRRRRPSLDSAARVAVLIPAHDEEATLGRLLEDLVAQAAPPVLTLVVAHNCSDRTGELAAGMGAEVLTLQAGHEKADALQAGLEHLASREWDAVLVIDADCRIDGRFLSRSRPRRDAAQQARILLQDEGDGRGVVYGLFSRLEDASLHVGRERLGCFAFLRGTGMLLGRDALGRCSWTARGLTEDRRQTYAFLRAGVSVHLNEDIVVCTPPPREARESWSQRRRWLSGGLPGQLREAGETARHARRVLGWPAWELPLAVWADARSQWLLALMAGTALLALLGGWYAGGLALLVAGVLSAGVAGAVWYRGAFLRLVVELPRAAAVSLGSVILGLLGRRPREWKRGR